MEFEGVEKTHRPFTYNGETDLHDEFPAVYEILIIPTSKGCQRSYGGGKAR